MIWALFLANAFDVPGTSANLSENSLCVFRQLLGDWYKAEARAGRQHSPIDHLQMGMLGKADDPAFNAHGAETNAVLRFAHEVLLPQYGAKLGQSRGHYEKAIGSLVRILDSIRKYACVAPPAAAEAFCEDVLVHIEALDALSIQCLPKHHLLMEMGVRSGRVSLLRGGPQCWTRT